MMIEAITGKLIFEKDQDNLRFEDSSGRVYEFTKLNFLTGRWRSGEGHLQYPGIEVRENGKIQIEGDTIFALKDQRLFRDSVVILGSLRNLNYNNGALLTTSADVYDLDKSVDIKNNERRMIVCQEDGEGNILLMMEGKADKTANATIILQGEKKDTGHLFVTLNGSLQLKLNDKNNGFVSEITVAGGESNTEHMIQIRDKSQNKITISKQGVYIEDSNQNKVTTNSTGITVETPKKGTVKGKSLHLDSDKIRIGKSDELKKIFDDLFAAIQTMTFGTGPQGSPTLPTPINWSQFEMVKSKVQSFLSE